jgi:hypothetical protein
LSGPAAPVSSQLRDLAQYHPPLEITDADFHGTPLGWAIHGSEHGWHCRAGDYPTTVRLLLEAGAALPEKLDQGTAAVQEILKRHAAEGSRGI